MRWKILTFFFNFQIERNDEIVNWMRGCSREIDFLPIGLTQILSLAVAGSAISSTYLTDTYDVNCTTLQSVLTYASLALVYIPVYAVKGM